MHSLGLASFATVILRSRWICSRSADLRLEIIGSNSSSPAATLCAHSSRIRSSGRLSKGVNVRLMLVCYIFDDGSIPCILYFALGTPNRRFEGCLCSNGSPGVWPYALIAIAVIGFVNMFGWPLVSTPVLLVMAPGALSARRAAEASRSGGITNRSGILLATVLPLGARLRPVESQLDQE